MKTKDIKKQILACGHHPSHELVAAVETALETLATPAFIERQFKQGGWQLAPGWRRFMAGERVQMEQKFFHEPSVGARTL
ncbi:MAG: hypothetical protein ABSH48_16170 [Verrucomicrobiota bacterium]|jgi:hypothetical protein